MKSTKFCLSQNPIIDAYLENPKKISKYCKSVDEYVNKHREEYKLSFIGKRYPTPRHKILTLPNQDLRFIKSAESYPGTKNIFIVRKGCWQMSVNKIIAENRLDFVISVAAAYVENYGYIYRFCPEVIERDLTTRFGREDYLQWKDEVNSDIQSLHDILGVVRNKISRVVLSVTCGIRSVRLCEKIGIPVKSGIAFLLPESNGF